MKLGIIAGCISLMAFIPYLISILRKKTRPNKVTWWIWSWLNILLFVSYKASGADETLWVPFTYIITCCIVAILSLKYGIGGWSALDICCLIGSVLGIATWFVFASPAIALYIYLSIDLLGVLPTIRKTYANPEQEDTLAWVLMALANVINLFAAHTLQFPIIIYPLYLFVCGSVITILSLRKPVAKR